MRCVVACCEGQGFDHIACWASFGFSHFFFWFGLAAISERGTSAGEVGAGRVEDRGNEWVGGWWCMAGLVIG